MSPLLVEITGYVIINIKNVQIFQLNYKKISIVLLQFEKIGKEK